MRGVMFEFTSERRSLWGMTTGYALIDGWISYYSIGSQNGMHIICKEWDFQPNRTLSANYSSSLRAGWHVGSGCR